VAHPSSHPRPTDTASSLAALLPGSMLRCQRWQVIGMSWLHDHFLHAAEAKTEGLQHAGCKINSAMTCTSCHSDEQWARWAGGGAPHVGVGGQVAGAVERILQQRQCSAALCGQGTLSCQKMAVSLLDRRCLLRSQTQRPLQHTDAEL
jgi:hypothetical protein